MCIKPAQWLCKFLSWDYNTISTKINAQRACIDNVRGCLRLFCPLFNSEWLLSKFYYYYYYYYYYY
jgi:hypothetical protein